VPYRDNKSFVMADIPGIIEGASEGRGLGLRFLRHIERNAVLLFMVPADSSDIRNEYNILLNELAQYNPELLDKQRVLAISKTDMLDEELVKEIRNDLPDIPCVFISSIVNIGLSELKDLLWKELNDELNRVTTITHRSIPINKEIDDDQSDDSFDNNKETSLDLPDSKDENFDNLDSEKEDTGKNY
jgi:GTP-binding protein